ncbi:hypothetical protein ACB496_12925 [Lelliottia nimipressuralis]|uniref:hypothetical protein n=1 Tax=Lelliottia nimipressuralis TaxID=69220 RepID=UPI003555F3BD
MTTKQNAIDLARTARSEAANTAKRTIAALIANWNECVKQAGFTGVFDFPTTGYTRKAQLIADLERCAAQLDDYVEPREELATMTVEQQIREFNAALTRVLDADEAHEAALDINAAFDDNLPRLASPVMAIFWHQHTQPLREKALNAAHTEALRLNEEWDTVEADAAALFSPLDGVDKNHDVKFEGYKLDRFGEKLACFSGVFVF